MNKVAFTFAGLLESGSVYNYAERINTTHFWALFTQRVLIGICIGLWLSPAIVKMSTRSINNNVFQSKSFGWMVGLVIDC